MRAYAHVSHTPAPFPTRKHTRLRNVRCTWYLKCSYNHNNNYSNHACKYTHVSLHTTIAVITHRYTHAITITHSNFTAIRIPPLLHVRTYIPPHIRQYPPPHVLGTPWAGRRFSDLATPPRRQMTPASFDIRSLSAVGCWEGCGIRRREHREGLCGR